MTEEAEENGGRTTDPATHPSTAPGDTADERFTMTTFSEKVSPSDSRVSVPRSERYPAGWAQVGDLAVGDEVFDVYGCPTRVVSASSITESIVIEDTA